MFYLNVSLSKEEDLCSVTIESAGSGSVTGRDGSCTHNSLKVGLMRAKNKVDSPFVSTRTG